MKTSKSMKERIMAVVVSALLVCLAAGLFAGCGQGKRAGSKYVGEWRGVSASMSGIELSVQDYLGDVVLTLDENGKCKLDFEGDSGSGTWEESDSGITIKDGDETLDLKESNGNLILDQDGVLITFEKQNASSSESSK